jgi:biotin transport system substrate-specific component
MTITDTLFPRRLPAQAYAVQQTLLVVTGSVLIATMAQLAINLPFSPVPITGQTFGILVTGMLLGGKRGAAAVLAYLLEGLSGLPVFAGGAGGAAYLFGPTGGYLLGFLPAAFITGKLAEAGWDRHMVTTILAMLLGSAVILAAGASLLLIYVGSERALPLGVYPFLAGDALKIAAAAILLPSLRRWANASQDK